MRKIGTIAGVLMLLSACGGKPESGSEGGAVGVGKDELANGTVMTATDVQNAGLVAIYHPHLPEFAVYPRPCSGVIIRSFAPPFTTVGVVSVVLTARHCVTANGALQGDIASPDQIRLIPSTNPGPALPNPPAGAIQAAAITELPGEASDTALITVLADWTSIADKRLGLYVGTSSSMVGRNVIAFGYGIDPVDNRCHANNTTVGAGIARMGSPFPIVSSTAWQSGQSSQYTYTNSNASGQAVVCGDSGGPDQLIALSSLRYIAGIHSGPNGAVFNSIPVNIHHQNALVGLFLSASNNRTFDLGIGLDGGIIFVANGDLRRSWVKFDTVTQNLTMNGSCVGMATNSSGQLVPRPMTCNAADATQRWQFTPLYQIRSTQNGQCWQSTTPGNLRMANCTTNWFGMPPSSQQWLFSAQP